MKTSSVPVRLLGAACALVMALGTILNGGTAPPQEAAPHALEALGFRPEPASAGTPGLDVLAWRGRFADLAAIEFREVQPGTDLVLRGSGGAMEALIALTPATTPSSLVLTVPAGLRMGVDGAAEGVHDGTPVRVMATFFQMRGADLVRVAGGLLLSSDQLTFWAERTEKRAPLVVSLRVTFGAAAPIDSAVQNFGPGAPALTAMLLTDADSNSQVTPGDTLRYRLTIPNAGAAIPNVVATIPLSVYHTSVPGTLNVSPFALDLADTTPEDVPLPLVLAGTDAEGQVLTYTIVTPPAHGAVVPASPGSGSVTYTPEANYHGPDSFTYSVNDGRLDSNEDGTVTLTVTARNDAPSFTKGADVTVLENSAAYSQTGWATAISAGGPDEAGQALTFNVTGNTNAALFSVAPAVASNGTLTFTPATDANGSATITLTLSDDGGTANGGADTSAPQTFLITVSGVNAAPSFTKGADQTVLEDAGAQTVLGWATAIDPGAGESGQTLTFQITNNTNAGLFSSGPAVSGTTGDLIYTPAAHANGTATITLRLMDNGGTANGGVDASPTQTFVINVTTVNDAPAFTKGADQTVLEDSGPQTVNAWATAISAGPADESGQTLTFTVTNNTNAALFSAGPAVNATTGNLTYTPAGNANGTATITLRLDDNGGVLNGGVNQSATQTFIINVTNINDAPSFTPGANQTVNEDAGAQSVSSFATAISAGPSEGSQTLTFNIVSNTNSALFSALPAIAANGTLTYTPAANTSGTATITYNLQDNGGTANGGVDITGNQSFTITVNTVNDAPGFTKGADQTVLEDVGVQTVPTWATAISAGPADESAQVLTFTVTNNTNAALFSAGPAVSATTGNLTYTPAANAFGTATITLRLDDDGGVLNGGVNQSATQTFVVTVTNVNDAPSFTPGANQTVNEDAGAQSVSSFITAISAGPNEGSQTLTFNIVSNTNSALFSAGPAIASNGTLTYTSAANASGVATITYNLQDNGGTANSGVDITGNQSFTITVNPVNDPPTVGNKSATAQTNMPISFNAANGLLNGANDPDNGVNGCTTTLSVVNISATSPAGGSAVLDNADGSFTFSPPPGVTGPVTFTYQVQDNGCPGTATSAAATVTVTVSGPTIWFVNAAAGGGGNGTLGLPFNALAGADGVDAASHRVFLFNGTYATGLTLNAGEWLVSQGATTASFDSFMGISPPAGTMARPSMGPAGPTAAVQGTVTMATNAILNGIAISTASTGFVATSVTGFSVANTSVSSSGVAVNVTSATPSGTATFNSTSSTGGANGITLTTAAGLWDFGSGSLSGNTGNAFNISGGTATVTYAGTIGVTGASSRPVNILNAGGSATFTGAITASGSAGGINLDNNDVATITFRGGLSLTTGGNVGFNAVNGATAIAVCATTLCGGGSAVINTIATTTGTALNVNATTIGASGLTFRSISANGGTNGILLNATGSTAGLTVTGTGSAGSGGTIQNVATRGASFINAVNISLTSMNFTNANTADGVTSNGVIGNNVGENGAIHLQNVTQVDLVGLSIDGAAQHGINGNNVTDLDISNTTIQNTGDEVWESNLYLWDIKGTVSSGQTSVLNNLNLTNDAGQFNIWIQNNDGTNDRPAEKDRLEITNSTFMRNGNNVLISDNVTVVNSGTGNTQVVVTGNTFNSTVTCGSPLFAGACVSDNIQVDAGTTSAFDATITGNTFTNGFGGQSAVNVSASGSGQGTFNVSNNGTLAVRAGVGINVSLASATAAGSLRGTIANNTLTTTVSNNAGAAINVVANDQGTIVVDVNNNSISGSNPTFFDQGIRGHSRGSATLAMILNNNAVQTVRFEGTDLSSGNGTGGETASTCVSFVSNNVDGSNGVPDYFLSQYTNTTFQIQGLSGSGTNPANVQSFIAATDDDPSGTDPTADVSGGLIVNYTNAICSTPLMAADGEAPPTVMAAALKTGDVGPALLAARTLWRKAGLSTDELRKLEAIALELTDLPGAMLGEARGSAIALDRTAAGWGWFVDPTPNDDDEFGKTIGAEAADRIDLLTVLVHEIGHVLGRPDVEAKVGSDDVMTGTLARGVRRAPIGTRATKLLPTETLRTPAFTLPAGRSATVILDAGIDVPFKASIGRVSAQATITGDAVSTVVSDDPSTGAPNDPTVTLVQCPGAACTASTTSGDFNGDGLADLVVYRPSNQTWYVRGQMYVQYGEPGDMPVPADYNGDGITDIAVYRPSTGRWFVRNQFILTFGDPGDLPIPADYDHDGAADLAVYRPSTGQWLVRNQFVVQFGDATDIPIPADYNGDGTVDVAVYRPGTGYFYVRNQFATQYGGPGYVPVVADYDGNGTADIAVYLPSTGFWFVRDQVFALHGIPGDVPMPRDFDGDGDADIAVYRPSTGHWLVRNQFDIGFGDPGDLPVPRGPQTGHALAGDFTGDRRTDVSVYRPSTGQWLVFGEQTVQFGDATDVPVPADYTGDGRMDIAVYRPSTGQWFVRNLLATTFGPANATPVPGDYNGDGLADVAVFVSATGEWRVRNQFTVTFGQAGDIPAPGDYDGDGITDLAVYRPSTGEYLVRNYFTTVLGQASDLPAPGDYNGDGILDAALYRPSTGAWIVRGQATVVFGLPTDIAIPGDYSRDGVTDIAVYRPSTGEWLAPGQPALQFGNPGDVPVVRIGRPQ